MNVSRWRLAFLCVVSVALLTGGNSALSATITESFEGSTSGSTTPPTGWSLIPVAGTASYVTTTGAGGSGLGGQITGNHPSNGSTIPAGYVVNDGGVPLDVTQPISGSYDFYIQDAGNYSSAMFMIGDIQTGIAQSDPGEFLAMFLRRQTFGARAAITDGAGATLATDNNDRINAGAWYTANFTWTPTSGTTGDFSYSVNYGSGWTETYSGYTFNSPAAYFGFGSGGYYSNDHAGIFDNISITGTAFSTVPEPTSLTLLVGLAFVGFGWYRSRRKP